MRQTGLRSDVGGVVNHNRLKYVVKKGEIAGS